MKRLEELQACFQGVIPSLIATCGADGEPNITYLSQVYYLDPKHVALSCQFFNKTRRNVAENPYATVVLQDPITFEAWKLLIRFQRAETEGPLFDTMSMRIQVIASHTGMAGVFKLISADVYDVIDCSPVEGYLMPPDPLLDAAAPPPVAGPMTELRGLQLVSERISRASDLEGLLTDTLTGLDECLGFSHSMVLLVDECTRTLVTTASRGYGSQGIGSEVAFGHGAIGTAAEKRRLLRISGVGAELRYGRAIRGRVAETGDSARLTAEIPLPGLPHAQAQLALPLLSCDRLVGVLAVESADPLAFDEWDEAFLQIVGHQIAVGVGRMQSIEDEPDTDAKARVAPVRRKAAAAKTTFVYYKNDDCVFVDGEYLIRNVPGKILWKVLRQRVDHGQLEFTNRELRLDPTLGLPPIKDNLESRLILLRRRLAEKCPTVRMVPVKRGRFALECDGEIELLEKEQA
ncbi:MAG TPA: GAF domain-containing protein [Planctomycetota bacterium]|nr:GAF domain-containing protein [Planctomycetota bacterium]